MGKASVEEALPDELVKRIIGRLLRMGRYETAWGVYLAHVSWRRARLLPHLSPEEVGLGGAKGEGPKAKPPA